MKEHGTWISVGEFCRKYKEPEAFYVDFRPDLKKMILFHDMTGFAKKIYINRTPEEIAKLLEEGVYDGEKYRVELEVASQEVETEGDLGGWHIFILGKNKYILMSHRATESKLGLGGEIGYENASQVLSDYGRMLYSSHQLNLEGSSINSKIIRRLSYWLKVNDEEMKRYWSEETYVVGDEKEKSSEMEYDVGCMRKLFRDSLPDGYYETFDDSITLHRINSWISDNDEYEENSFRPVVVLNHNIAIMVGDEYYDGSTPERALRIRYSDSEEQKEILRREIDSIKKELQRFTKEQNEKFENLQKLIDSMYM